MNMILFGPLALDAAVWWQLFSHFALLSLLAIGGAITTVPDMHRYIVGQHGWLDDAQFAGSIALAQAAPGPNVLFVAVIGFNVGGLAGVAVPASSATINHTPRYGRGVQLQGSMNCEHHHLIARSCHSSGSTSSASS